MERKIRGAEAPLYRSDRGDTEYIEFSVRLNSCPARAYFLLAAISIERKQHWRCGGRVFASTARERHQGALYGAWTRTRDGSGPRPAWVFVQLAKGVRPFFESAPGFCAGHAGLRILGIRTNSRCEPVSSVRAASRFSRCRRSLLLRPCRKLLWRDDRPAASSEAPGAGAHINSRLSGQSLVPNRT